MLCCCGERKQLNNFRNTTGVSGSQSSSTELSGLFIKQEETLSHLPRAQWPTSSSSATSEPRGTSAQIKDPSPASTSHGVHLVRELSCRTKIQSPCAPSILAAAGQQKRPSEDEPRWGTSQFRMRSSWRPRWTAGQLEGQDANMTAILSKHLHL